MPTWANISFQDSNSPLMEQLIFFHDHTLMILLMITVAVTYLMLTMFQNKLIMLNVFGFSKMETIFINPVCDVMHLCENYIMQ